MFNVSPLANMGYFNLSKIMLDNVPLVSVTFFIFFFPKLIFVSPYIMVIVAFGIGLLTSSLTWTDNDVASYVGTIVTSSTSTTFLNFKIPASYGVFVNISISRPSSFSSWYSPLLTLIFNTYFPIGTSGISKRPFSSVLAPFTIFPSL